MSKKRPAAEKKKKSEKNKEMKALSLDEVPLTQCVKTGRKTLLPEIFLKSSVERFCQTG